MKLKALFKDIAVESVKGSREVEITGISTNSKVVGPGNLFIAKKGSNHDGRLFIPEAINAGAAAILSDFYDPTLKDVVQIVHPQSAMLEATLAARYYHFPSDELFTVGITGTNGKTTTAALVKHLMDSIDKPCGLIGTIEYIIGEHHYPASLTSPDVVSNHKMLREMVLQGCKAAVMETSSHGLEQGRLQFIDFDAAIFTNLSHDHLDYHGTMENYCLAKNRLFRELHRHVNDKRGEKVAIVNADDPWATMILEGCDAPTQTFGMASQANVTASDIVLNLKESRFMVRHHEKRVPFFLPLIGKHNIQNALAVVTLGLSLGVPLEKLADIMSQAPQVKGRLERVSNDLGLNIFVDFAHTPKALENVLSVMRELTQGKVITVFGCGGNRDALKRPVMAQAAEKFSDFTIVTTDNARSEDPGAIAQDIVAGFSGHAAYTVELDRREAISKAIQSAKNGDTILIAGKGHESRQLFMHQVVEFSDADVAKACCTPV